MMKKFIKGLFRKPYYFPREDFLIFTRLKLPKEFDHLKRAEGFLNMVNIDGEVCKGVFKVTVDMYGHFRNDPRIGDVYISTRKSTNILMALIFTKVEECYREEGYILLRGEVQNFGFAGDLLQIERMKELVWGGKKMKPVVL